MDGISDAKVIASSLSEPPRFGEVFERHYDVVLRFLRRRVMSPVADEIASQVFLEAFASRDRFDPSWQSARPWLFGIANNLVRHHLRSEEARFRAYAKAAREDSYDPFVDLDGSIDASLMAPKLTAALLALELGDREAFLLFVWAGLSYAEVATALDIPIGTVRSRLNRARTQLRELLEAGTSTSSEEVTR